MTDIRFEKSKIVFETNPDADGIYGALGTKYYDAIGANAWEKRGLNEDSLTTINKEIPHDHIFDYLMGTKNQNGYKGYFSIVTLIIKRESLLRHQITFNPSLRLHQDSAFIYQCAYYLNLFSGEINKPVAVRGVHANNRYILNPDVNNSTSKYYLCLHKWSINENLNIKYQHVFEAHYYHYSNKLYPKIIAFFRSLPCYLTNSYYRKMLLKK